MTSTFSPQAVSGNDFAVRTGTKASYYGITAAIDGSVNTQLDVTVGSSWWILLGNGAFYDNNVAYPAVSTNIAVTTTNGTYTLWADQLVNNQTSAPIFTVSATAPSSNSVAIATVVVASNIISSVAPYPQGKQETAATSASPKFIQAALAFGTATTVVGELPANAVIDYAILSVGTAFNAGTNNYLEVGKTGALAGLLPQGTNGMATATTAILANFVTGSIGSSAYEVIATYTQTGTAASAGAATLTIYFH